MVNPVPKASAILDERDEEARVGGWYSWRALLAMMMCICILMGVSIYSFIILLVPMAHDLQWSPMQSGGLVSAMWFAAPFALVCAPLVKRVGAWRLVVAGVSVQALAFIALVYADAFWQVYAIRLGMGFGKIVTVTAAPVIVARYFRIRFPLAMSLIWAATVGSGVIVAPLTETLIATLGWRMAAWAIAGIIFLVLPIALLLLRVGRESFLEREATASRSFSQLDIDTLTRKGGSEWGVLVATLGVWPMCFIAIGIAGAGIFSIALHSQQIAYLMSLGMTASFGAMTFAFLSAGAISGSALTGWMLDRLPAVRSPIVIGFSIYVGVSAFFLLQVEPSHALACIASFLIGIGIGGGEFLWITLLRFKVPTAAYATAYGGWYFSLQIGYAAGGALSGWGVEIGGYTAFLGMLAVAYLPTTIMGIWLARLGTVKASAHVRDGAGGAPTPFLKGEH